LDDKWANSFTTGRKKTLLAIKAYLNINNASYTPPSGLGNWQPTLPDFSPAVLPDWAGVRTFASSKEDFSISEPMSYDTDASSLCTNQMNYIRKKVNYIKANPDNEGYWIAQFWSDDFSPLTIYRQVDGML
jgi:phage tail protein X